MILAELSELSGDVAVVELAGAKGIRWRTRRELPVNETFFRELGEAAGLSHEQRATAALPVVDETTYFIPLPGTTDLLVLSFTSPARARRRAGPALRRHHGNDEVDRMSHVRLRFPVGSEWLALSQVRAMTDLQGWAEASVAKLVAARGRSLKPKDAEPLVVHLVGVGEHYLKVGGTGCLLHVPDGVLPVRAMVRIETYEGPDNAADFRKQCELLVPEMSWLVDPVGVSSMETAAGTATRIQTRIADPEQKDAVVRDTVFYSWWFADLPETILATVAFTEVADTARYLPAVDAVIAGIERVDGAPSVAGSMPEGDYTG